MYRGELQKDNDFGMASSPESLQNVQRLVGGVGIEKMEQVIFGFNKCGALGSNNWIFD
jgi:hypothetical protein